MDVAYRMGIWLVSVVASFIVAVTVHWFVGILVLLSGLVVGDQVGNRVAEDRQAEKLGAATRTPRPRQSVASELGRLADLHASGALTDEEYEAAKKKALET
jgi:hypothetical protein